SRSRSRDPRVVMHTSFHCMGCEMSLQVADDGAARGARHLLERFDACLSRFDPDSELSRLNRDRRETVPASALLRAAVAAARWAAERSRGLVDPTLLPALAAQGYEPSLAGATPPSLRSALAAAPPRRPARPARRARGRAIEIDAPGGTVTRPPRLALDTGGSTKGLAADAVAYLLDDEPGYVVDCGGDLRIRAPRSIAVAVEHPLAGTVAHTLQVASGAVATSGLGRRLWRRGDGFAHHLLDPATGEPAWTGVVQATALAPSALEAETLAKAALLAGPRAARRLLAAHGGVLVHDDGAVEPVGPRARPSLQIIPMEVAA
ncbi:MAG TPA: FAD:protein FMN transferase, partial [Solirubrobacteraceae bacterium]|nr:FAD:protein FMN transferase [Solirubrobacteraceae bacterium]